MNVKQSMLQSPFHAYRLHGILKMKATVEHMESW